MVLLRLVANLRGQVFGTGDATDFQILRQAAVAATPVDDSDASECLANG